MNHNFTQEQREIMASRAPQLIVHACPGSGKTTTLIGVIDHWVAHGVSPQRILGLSFSNSTVSELRRKITHAGVKVYTVHALGNRLLNAADRDAARKLLQPSAARAMLSRAVQSMLKNIKGGVLWSEVPGSRRKARLQRLRQMRKSRWRQILQLFELTAALDCDVETALEERMAVEFHGYLPILKELYPEYQRQKAIAQRMDYGDMVALAAQHVEHAEWEFTHVVVDELQDCTAAQVQFLAKLVVTHGLVLRAFGDQYQAIYGFAGAAGEQLQKYLPSCMTLSMTITHRMTHPVAQLASAVARLPVGRQIIALRGGHPPRWVASSNEDVQLKAIVRRVQWALTQTTETVAVLMRTKSQGRMLGSRLRMAGIETNQQGKQEQVMHVKRVFKLLRGLLQRPQVLSANDLLRLRRQLAQWAESTKAIEGAIKLVLAARRSATMEGIYKGVERAYMTLIGGVRANPDVRNELAAWEPRVRQCASLDELRQLSTAVEPRVTICTIHAAKGREWDHVLVPGVTEGLLPIHHARDERTLAEEGRLLFVAITRARKTLRLYHAPSRRRGRILDMPSSALEPYGPWMLQRAKRK